MNAVKCMLYSNQEHSLTDTEYMRKNKGSKLCNFQRAGGVLVNILECNPLKKSGGMFIISVEQECFHHRRCMGGSKANFLNKSPRGGIDFAALERIRRRAYVEVEGWCPRRVAKPALHKNDRAQQTALNGNTAAWVGQEAKGGAAGIEIELDSCISIGSWKACSTGAANWIDEEDGW